MEKLIELLNEYKWKEEWTIECDVPHNDWYSEYAYEHEELIIISKQYWFIKWLVENEKIEWEKVYENLKDYEVEIRIRAVKKLELSSEEKSLWYLELLMLLSIQDNPIEFLVSILK